MIRPAEPRDAGAIAAIYNQTWGRRRSTWTATRAGMGWGGPCSMRSSWRLRAPASGRSSAGCSPENEASVGLCHAAGCREVGVFTRHSRLDGEWRDVLYVERLIGEAASQP